MDRSTCGGDDAVRDRTRTEPQAIGSRPAARVVWDDRIELVGWTTPATVQAGKDIDLAVVYKVLQPLDRSWKAFVHLDGPTRINGDHEPLEGRCPTTTWRPGDYLVDHITMTATLPGRYAINIGFFRGLTPRWTNLPISAAPAVIRDSYGQLRLATIVVDEAR